MNYCVINANIGDNAACCLGTLFVESDTVNFLMLYMLYRVAKVQ